MRWLMLVIMFIALGAFFIISNENLHLNNSVEFNKFGNLYYTWLGRIFDNTKSLTGYIAKSEWLPDESLVSNLNKSS